MLHHCNQRTGGAIAVAAADRLAPTSITKGDDGFSAGF